MILAVTGHRPQKLGGFSPEAQRRLESFAFEIVRELAPSRVLTGMALGWDQAVAVACRAEGIPFVACLPCAGQDGRWRPEQRDAYRTLLADAAERVMVNAGEYAAWKMLARDEYMVNNSDKLLALFNGSAGGTKHTVDFATSIGREIVNCWDQWLLHCQSH